MRWLVLVGLVAGCRIGFDARIGDDDDTFGPGGRLRVGTSWACELRESGELYCWGTNAGGQFGTGAITGAEPLPIRAGGDMLWKDVALGTQHACALDAQGHAWCWGVNGSGQLGLATPACGNTTVDAGEDCDDGNTANGDTCSAICTIAAPPSELMPKQLPDNRVYARIFARTAQTWAIAADGTLWSWGRNGARQLGTGDNGDRGKPTQTLITAPQIGVDNEWLAIGGGDDHACGVQQNGSLWCWGSNGNGQLGQGGSTMIVREFPEVVLAGTTWMEVAAGRDHSCAIDRAGSAHCWGLNGEAQLGLGDILDRNVPAPLTGANWDRLGTGLTHSCALRGDGSLWCWGRNSAGQGGNGTITPTQMSPTQVPGDWREVASGGEFTCAIKTDDSIWCWGDGSQGRLGNGATADSSTPVQVMLP